MVGQTDSFLAKNSDIVLNTSVEQEACPNNLAPTTSTTAQLVMGDALAVYPDGTAGFQSDDFAKFHPGGMQKKLYPCDGSCCGQWKTKGVLASQSLKEVIVEMTAKRLGITAVVDAENMLLGIVTDGDLRRMLEKSASIDTVTAGDIMTRNPKTIGPDELAVDALDLLRKNEISQLVVIESGKYTGIIHLHDLIREDLFNIADIGVFTKLLHEQTSLRCDNGGRTGSRFWPMSRTEYPKQFLDILGTGKTLIQQTLTVTQNLFRLKIFTSSPLMNTWRL